MDFESDDFKKLWNDPVVQATVDGINAMMLKDLQENYSNDPEIVRVKFENIKLGPDYSDEDTLDFLAAAGCLDAQTLACEIACSVTRRQMDFQQLRNVIPPEIATAAEVLEVAGLDIRDGEHVIERAKGEVLASGSAIANKTIIALVIGACTGPDVQSYIDDHGEKGKIEIAAKRCLHLFDVADAIMAHKLWRMLPAAAIDAFLDVLEDFGQVLAKGRLGKSMLDMRAEIKAAIDADPGAVVANPANGALTVKPGFKPGRYKL